MTRSRDYNPPVHSEFLSVDEVATYLYVSAMTIYRLIKANEIPAIRVGRMYRIKRTDLEAYVQQGND